MFMLGTDRCAREGKLEAEMTGERVDEYGCVTASGLEEGGGTGGVVARVPSNVVGL